MKCVFHLAALLVLMYSAYTVAKPLVRSVESREGKPSTPTEITNSVKDEDAEITRMRLLLMEALEKAARRSRRRPRGYGRYYGNRRLKCLKRDRTGRCIKYAILGIWHGWTLKKFWCVYCQKHNACSGKHDEDAFSKVAIGRYSSISIGLTIHEQLELSKGIELQGRLLHGAKTGDRPPPCPQPTGAEGATCALLNKVKKDSSKANIWS